MAYKRIVMGTDGSSASAEALRLAAKLAAAGRAELIVAHVWQGRPQGADAVLANAVEAAGRYGATKVRGELRGGIPADALAELGAEVDAGLMVVSGGRGQRFTLGDVAQRLSHHAPCDLLIAGDRPRPMEGPIYRHVAIATDGSPTADRAARKGYDLAAAVGARVTLVFVGHPATGKLICDDTIATYGQEVDSEVAIVDGDPAEQILDAAEKLDADLIVVGNKGMTGAKRFLLGSVPAKVTEVAERDVLIARTVVQSVSEVAPGQGGIIVRAGEKLAAFVDEGGELHIMSARCTHMGCTVAWDPGLRVFRCPCHGSRYSPTGEVVQGPAQRPLAPA
jgi:nucleotide-binding universal stress UspA family protein/nitrite reductase/ring-hydroxylating ferredoxin subunit